MKNKVLKVIGISVLVLAFLIGVPYTIISVIKEDITERMARQKALDDEKFKNAFCSQKVDSLRAANNELSKYKALTQAMLHRDEATKQLKHKIGDVVLMKNDSSRVIIEDVLIGGGKYDYYVKYRILFKDNTTKEVKPELIY